MSCAPSTNSDQPSRPTLSHAPAVNHTHSLALLAFCGFQRGACPRVQRRQHACSRTQLRGRRVSRWPPDTPSFPAALAPLESTQRHCCGTGEPRRCPAARGNLHSPLEADHRCKPTDQTAKYGPGRQNIHPLLLVSLQPDPPNKRLTKNSALGLNSVLRCSCVPDACSAPALLLVPLTPYVQTEDDSLGRQTAHYFHSSLKSSLS